MAVQCVRAAGRAAARPPAIFFLDDFGQAARSVTKTATYVFRGSEALTGGSTEATCRRAARRAPGGAPDRKDRLVRRRSASTTCESRLRPTPRPARGCRFKSPMTRRNGWPCPLPARITAKSALDVSFLLQAPAGERGSVTDKDGHLQFRRRGACPVLRCVPPRRRRRSSSPRRPISSPTAWRVRASTSCGWAIWTAPYGPNRSLFDDARDDTKEFDPVALERLDHLIAALKKRGIYVAIELQSKRRFRAGRRGCRSRSAAVRRRPRGLLRPDDRPARAGVRKGVAGPQEPGDRAGPQGRPGPGLGDACGRDVDVRPDRQSRRVCRPRTPRRLHELAEKRQGHPARRFWESLESAHLKKMADALRKDELRVPIAGVSHWRREPEFCAAQAGAGAGPDRRPDLLGPARRGSRPRCTRCSGPRPPGASEAIAEGQAPMPIALMSWASGATRRTGPGHSRTKRPTRCWRLSRRWTPIGMRSSARGIFIYPLVWGAGAGGHGRAAKTSSRSPRCPTAARTSTRSGRTRPHSSFAAGSSAEPTAGGRAGRQDRRAKVAVALVGRLGLRPRPAGHRHPLHPGRCRLDRRRDRVVPATGALDRKPVRRAGRDLDQHRADRVDQAASRLGDRPGRAHRAFAGSSGWKREVADPGRPPFLQEPVTATITWRRKGKVQAYVLTTKAIGSARSPLEALPGGEGVILRIDGKTPAFHWELTVE